MKNIYILVPSYNPDEEIMSAFLKELKKEFKNILIVNDGSINNEYFKKLESDGYEIFTNHVNLGKGRAIKNGMNYLLNKYDKIEGIVTCDCDGQHTVKDIKKIANKIDSNKNELILGVRKFDDKKIPLRSRMGNNITKNIFYSLIKSEISDTQTGLRGFNKNLMINFLDVVGERYEYETKILIKCKLDDIKIIEVPIETIYMNNNITSHFNPVKDSIRIYRVFTKYIFSSLSSFIFDLILFVLVFYISKNIIISTIVSRLLSSIWNYYMNANLVFRKLNLKSLLLYYILVFIQMILSGVSVTYICNVCNIPVVLIKILVDLILFIINYLIQKNIVFKRGRK